ncbi:hypothetical protein L6164_022254 [Bauhinia variegata]|uniref:Uncharacterized protein n=1 Tax=Bauhinia variegata TaxID=167791 RepID=A0ACB9MHG4_BAUVA|nr:hypothetical protein L6164_022254 [Bauhinia variegata]
MQSIYIRVLLNKIVFDKIENAIPPIGESNTQNGKWWNAIQCKNKSTNWRNENLLASPIQECLPPYGKLEEEEEIFMKPPPLGSPASASASFLSNETQILLIPKRLEELKGES